MAVWPIPVRSGAFGVLGAAFVAALILTTASAGYGEAPKNGVIDLGTASDYNVLAGSMVTNVGSTTLGDNLGVSPGTAITGFSAEPNGIGGSIHAGDGVSLKAQDDVTTAYGVAAGLTPTKTGIGDLTGLSLVPGIYNDGTLSLSGKLTLTGNASSVWVFQSASTLITGSGAEIVMAGGASACNVFWQIGSSATLGPGTKFYGTILAYQQIDLGTGTIVHGRLLAEVGAVNLNFNTLTSMQGCSRAETDEPTSGSEGDEPTAGSAVDQPPISDSPAATPTSTIGAPYSLSVAQPTMPNATYTVSTGSLPPGLSLDKTTGLISGTPTSSESYEFSITTSDGRVPDVETTYRIESAVPSTTVPSPTGPSTSVPTPVLESGVQPVTPPADTSPPLPVLAFTGENATGPLASASAFLLVGLLLLVLRFRMSASKRPGPRHSL